MIWLIASGSSAPVAAGIGIGIVGGLALARYLVSQLFGVKTTDFWSLAAPVACIVAAAIAATRRRYAPQAPIR